VPVDTRRVRLRAERGANRAAIVAAAEAALRERPFREVTVEDLMQAAGLARTQFYRHFDDLSDLVLTVSAGAFEDILDHHERLVDIADLDVATLRAAIAPAVEAFALHGPLVRALSEAAAHDEAVEQVYNRAQRRYVALTERLVTRAAADGAPITHPAQTARMLHLANLSYLIDAFGGEPTVEPEVALDTIVEVWSAALGL
jgi:TetR/AcrR family transcriptional regulator, ethionamide resistance regulator